MENLIQERTEILFLYEIENANPNGDPLNENRPRFDVEDSRAVVSDVRLKRTIRDYWFEYKGFNGSNGNDIFVRETKYSDKENAYIASGKHRVEDFKKDKGMTKEEHQNHILNTCIDIRVFGGVLPMDKDSFTFTGPCQFQMGKSLNKTEIIEELGTGAFASAGKKKQASFRTEYKLPYAIIGFNGIINEKAAAYTKMTNTDKDLLFDGIWNGTKNLISRSKFGQTPLLLLTIDYKEPFYIGNLRQRVKLACENELKVRRTDDYDLDVTKLIQVLTDNKDKIKSIKLQVDNRLSFLENGTSIDLNEKLNEIS
ncbi:MAG TPA: type I-B CRISPR-associated protein Cas7/Csh2 [Saprospiraceae bacterium]|nr:type I-B CRISPR-associated protein Cas7/Csh2 [Saprospiraceae bacterium]